MDMADAHERLAAHLRGRLTRREPMAPHTSWRTGGVADRAYVPADTDDFVAFVRALPHEEPVLVVGLGSNLLVRDGGLRGTVILTHRALGALSVAKPDARGGEIHAEAGVACPKVARLAARHGLAGAEFLAGIPGTVGGALAMNAGCFGSETWRIVADVRTIDRTGRLQSRARTDYDIGYRHVAPKMASQPPAAPADPPLEEWFLSATFWLAPGSAETSRRQIRELLERRIATQPLAQPNAGSVFRNPAGHYAARLIEACGLKGHTIGRAMIAEKHANFVVNLGGARAADIEALIGLAERAVHEKFGIELEREVRIVGEP
jgi:UDP-N-acetylmuramate dehydrogenase